MIESIVVKSSLVKNYILEKIQNGKFLSGQRLPSEKDLARELGVNHLTVRRGLLELANERLIDKRPRVGNFVKEVRSQEKVTQIAVLFPSWMQDMGTDSAIESLRQVEGEVPDIIYHPYPSIIINEINRILDPSRYAITALYYRQDSFWQDVGPIIRARGVEGVIFCPSFNYSALSKLKEAGVRVVLLDTHVERRPLDIFRVVIDNIPVWSQILNRFHELGHRRICIFRYKGNNPIDDRECEIVLDDFRRRTGLRTPEDLLVLDIDNKPPFPDYRFLKNIVDFTPRPTAVIVPDEFAASVIFRECYQHQLRIPQDISLAAKQDHAPSIHAVPLAAPNSLRIQTRAVQIAIRHLMQLLAGKSFIEETVILKAEVQWKASVGPVPNGNPQK